MISVCLTFIRNFQNAFRVTIPFCHQQMLWSSLFMTANIFFLSHDTTYVVVFCTQGCILSHFSHVRLCATLWTAACQASLSMGFSRQEYWSGLPFPLQEIFLTQELNLCLLCLPALATGFFTTSAPLGSTVVSYQDLNFHFSKGMRLPWWLRW